MSKDCDNDDNGGSGGLLGIKGGKCQAMEKIEVAMTR
jgi:hypothetical protein